MPTAPLNICFVGIANLPALAPEYAHLGIGGAELQQSLVAKTLAKRGLKVSMVVGDYGQPDRASWSGVTTFKAYRLNAGIPGVRFFHPAGQRYGAPCAERMLTFITLVAP